MCCDQCLTLWLHAKNCLLRGERRIHRVAAKLGEETRSSRRMVKFMLTLVRHGETAYNKEGIIQGQLDIPLSDEGLMQADLLGKYLRNDKFTSIYASDLKRAYQTAEAIVKHSVLNETTIIPDARLRERNFGVLEGEPSERLKDYKREAESRLQKADGLESGSRSPSSFTPEGAETIYEVKNRAIHFFEDLCEQFLNSVELNSQQPRKTRRMSPPGDEKSPTGSSTSESSVEPLGVDICSTPDSVGPVGTTHLCTDGSQTDSGYPSPEGIGYEYNPEKAFKVAASLEVKGHKDGGAKKSPTSQRIKDAILGVKKTSKQQGKAKDSDQGGVVVLAKELETRTRIQSDDTQSANILVTAHGAWIRELIRYFVNELKCYVPGGKHMANRMSYNTGMSKFLVDLSNEIPHIECIYMHKKEHLKDLQFHLRESP